MTYPAVCYWCDEPLHLSGGPDLPDLWVGEDGQTYCPGRLRLAGAHSPA